MADRERLFTEVEVGEIIRRAVELQEKGQAQTYTPGVTDTELARIAQEIGVAPEYLRQALSEHGKGSIEENVERLRFSRDVERVVDGELDPNDFDYVANELPMANSPQMQPTQIGRTLKANVMAGVTSATVNVTARNGRTRVKVNAKPILTTVFGGQAAFLGTIFGSVLMTAHQNLPAGIAVLVSGIAGGIALFYGGLKASNRQATTLADNIVRSIEERLQEASAEEMRKNVSKPTTQDESDPEVQIKSTN